MNSFLCERCGTEIGQGELYVQLAIGDKAIFVHKFPYQCDQDGLDMVKQLEAAFEAQKEPCD